MPGEFQPKFDYRPQFAKDSNGVWQPLLDESTGLQVVKRIPLPTFHQLFWPGDKTVSAIAAETWFTLTKGWDDVLNPVTGHYWFIGSSLDAQGRPLGPPVYLQDGPIVLKQDWEWTEEMPVGTKKVSVQLDAHDHAIGWTFETKAL